MDWRIVLQWSHSGWERVNSHIGMSDIEDVFSEPCCDGSFHFDFRSRFCWCIFAHALHRRQFRDGCI